MKENGAQRNGRRGLLDITEDWITGISLGIAALLVVAAVVLRFVFHYSISAFDELTRYLIIWSTFIGGSRLLRKDQHITIDVLIRRLPEQVRLTVQTTAYILGTVFCLLLFISGLQMIGQSIQVEARSMSNLRLPMWIPQLAIPLGSVLMLFRFVEKIINNVKRIRTASSSSN